MHHNKNTNGRNILLAALLPAMVLGGARQSNAADYKWIGNAGTTAANKRSFSQAGNWTLSDGTATSSVPSGAADTAIFGSTGTYPATTTYIGNISGGTYGQIQYTDAPTFIIGQDNTSLFTLAGVGANNTVISRTDTGGNFTQTIRNEIALGTSTATFDINGGGVVKLNGGLFNQGTKIISGATVSGSTASSVVKTGNGTLQVDNTSQFSGSLSILAGTYQTTQIRSALDATTGNPTYNQTTSGVGLGTSPIILGGDTTTGTLAYTGTATAARNYSRGFAVGTGGGVFANNSANTVVSLDTVGISGMGSFTLDGTGASTVVSVPISVSGGLTKNGAGAARLDALNTYGGATTVNAGTLEVGASGKLGDANVSVAGSAILQLDGTTSIADTASLVVQSGGVVNLNFDGSLSETVASLQLGDTVYSSGDFNVSTPGVGAYFSGTGNIHVVPEPASVAMLGLGAIGVLKRRRR